MNNHLAHYRKEDNTPQSVENHLVGTANVARWFSCHTLFPNTLDTGCLLHDFGKLTDDFSKYVIGDLDVARGSIDHSFGGAKFLEETYTKSDPRVVKFISRGILTHHGITDWIRNEDEDTYEKRISKDKYWNEILQNKNELNFLSDIDDKIKLSESEILSVRKKIRLLSNRYSGRTEQEESFAFYLCLLDRLFLSALMDADRIDTANFMLNTDVEQHYVFKDVLSNAQEKLNDMLDNFMKRSDAISKTRMSISDRCYAYSMKDDIRICKLIVPTGGGKTVSSMRFAVNYGNRSGKDKIFYIAPFMSILEQNSDVIKSIFGDSNVLEHHSNIMSDIISQKDYNDELRNYELRSEKWDSPVIATTLVQFLNTIFNSKSQSIRRFHRLYNSIIVVDEVQAIPPKCTYLFNLAMNFLAYICNCTIILCTATQPPLENTQKLKYPIILDTDPSMSGDFSNDFLVLKRSELIYVPKAMTYNQAELFCSDVLKCSNSMLFITNTKKACYEMYTRLKEYREFNVYHLSTAMCPQHRKDTLNKIRGDLSNNIRVMCVSTQLIEAGVDISFECVVRSFSGLDSVTQASGRCNRNGEYDNVCKTYIVKLIEENIRPLIQISNAQIASESAIYNHNNDLNDSGLMKDYFLEMYRIFSQVRGLQFRYYVNNNIDEDILNLLSLNKNRCDLNEDDPSFRFRRYAPKTAGDLFNVIDTQQTDIIVPYNDDAKKLIRLIAAGRIQFVNKRLFAKLQKYTVSVYEHQFRRLLDEGIVSVRRIGDQNIFTLNELNYGDTGLHEEVSQEDLIL